VEFAPFLILLAEIEDPRRAEGKQYRLPHVVLFAILAMLAFGAVTEHEGGESHEGHAATE